MQKAFQNKKFDSINYREILVALSITAAFNSCEKERKNPTAGEIAHRAIEIADSVIQIINNE